MFICDFFISYSLETLLNSIKTKLYTLSDSTVIYPGHYGSSSIGEEKVSNPHTT